MEAKPLGENCPWQGSGAGQSETRAALAQSREAELSGKEPAASLGYILNSALPGQQKKRADSLQKGVSTTGHIS